MPISEVWLISFTLLLTAMIAANLCRHITLPYTVVLVVLGIGINLAEQFLPFANHLQQFRLTPDVVLFIFLPALIFESGLSLDALKQLPKIKIIISSKRKHQWISKTPLFAGLPQKILETLAKKIEYVNFLPNDIIFNEHDKGHSLYILVNGCVDVYKENEQGDAIHLIELYEGGFIGEHALLINSRRSATIKAKTYVTLLRLTAAEVLKMSKVALELKIRLHEVDLQRQITDLKQ